MEVAARQYAQGMNGHVSQAVAILMLTKSVSDADAAAHRIAVSYPPICKDLITEAQASIFDLFYASVLR